MAGLGRRRRCRGRSHAQPDPRLARGACQARPVPRTRRAAVHRFSLLYCRKREQGIREAAKFYEENMKMFGELRLVRALSDEQIEIMRNPRRAPAAELPRIEDAITNGGFLCGSPEQIIGHLKALEKRYPGLDRVSVSLSVGVPKAVALEQLERFGKEVMPAFAQAKTPELVPAQ